jgi:very-short-patch-repair endonuclease
MGGGGDFGNKGVRTMDALEQLKAYYETCCADLSGHIQENRVRQVYETLIAKYRYHFLIPLNFCESPAEKMLYLCLLGEQLYAAARICGTITVVPQLTIKIKGKEFRPDFTVTVSAAGKELKAIIEVDGHEFHEKTKEQARKDRARERMFVKHGYTVLRFTGQEVYEDPFRCAEEVYKTLEVLLKEKTVRAAGD